MAIGWWQSVGGKRLVASGRREEEGGGADTTLKTKTPHVNVGEKLSPNEV